MLTAYVNVGLMKLVAGFAQHWSCYGHRARFNCSKCEKCSGLECVWDCFWIKSPTVLGLCRPAGNKWPHWGNIHPFKYWHSKYRKNENLELKTASEMNNLVKFNMQWTKPVAINARGNLLLKKLLTNIPSFFFSRLVALTPNQWYYLLK